VEWFLKAKISVVVTTSSEHRLPSLLRLMESIERQQYQNLEIICVIERSKELRQAMEKEAQRMKHTLQVSYFEKVLGANLARNIGIGLSTGDIVALIDDDARLHPNWANAVAQVYEDDTVIGVTGPVLPLWEDSSMSWWPKEFEWVIGCSGWTSNNVKRSIRGVLGTNASFRNYALLETGYNESFGPKGHTKDKRNEWAELGEETELSLRIRMRTRKQIIYSPDVIVYHEVPKYKTSLAFARQRSFQVGRTKKEIDKLGAYSETDVLGPEKILLRRLILNSFLPHSGAIRLSDYAQRFLLTITCVFYVALGYILD
jgi:glucosyl-dolichyl phosphate glucuronosyltransferase